MAKLSSLLPASLLAICVAAPVYRAEAQVLPIPHFSVMGGVSQWDLNGTGTAPFGAIRVDVPLLVILAEGSLGVFRPKEDIGSSTYIIPEAQVQYQFLPYLVKPYLGIGGGLVKAVSGPSSRSDYTVSASAGVRVSVPVIGAGVRGELRIRSIGGSFGGGAAEWTLGLSF